MNQFETFYNVVKKPWVIVSYVLLIILTYHYVDKPVALYFHQLHLNHYTTLALHLVTALGKWALYIGLFFLLGLYFRYIKKNKVYEQRVSYLFICIACTNFIASVVKVIVSRARPALFFEDHLFGFYWLKMNNLFWSFPSGHAITVGALAASLGFLFPRYFYCYLLGALFVIATRIILEFHYLSDVLSGFYLSILIVGYSTALLKKNRC